MDTLVYNISYDIAGLALILAVLAIHMITYRYTSPNNQAFQRFLFASVVNGLMDILTAVTISCSGSVPDSLNMALNVVYQISAGATAYLGMAYVCSCIGPRTRIGKIVDLSAAAVYLLVLLVNAQTNIMFAFIHHSYVKGPLFQISYFVSLFYVLHAGIVMLLHRRQFSTRQLTLNSFYVTIPCCFALYQVYHPEVLLTFFAGTLSALFMIFSLETADYQRLQTAMRDLEEARASEMNANRAKSDFLARMSHEIRTPINGILGMNGMILKETRDGEIREYAENIDAAGRGLLALINDILDLSKIESGRMELVSVSYHLSSVINDCYHMIAQQARERGLYVSTEIDPALPYRLYGDEVRVRQIIVNLLTNAVKYTERGGITFSVSGAVEPGEKGGKVLRLKLRVQDTGIGIRKEDQERLFQSFQRLDEARNRNIEGSGLGLRITAQLVELMGGEIQLESVYGMGSVFTVTIPQLVQGEEVVGRLDVAAAAEERAARKKDKVLTAPEMRLLVVDDVELNLKVVRGFLKETGIQIDTAFSGPQCLQMTENTKYDLILLDHMMPDMDGVETFRRLRSTDHSLNRDTPVVMMTANAIVGAREEYLEMGFDDYLSKPVVEADLLRVIDRLAAPDLVHWTERAQEEKKAADENWMDKLTFLDTKSALLYCASSQDFYREMLETFVKENRMGQIQQFFSREDWKNYAVQVHALKGTARTIGAVELSEKALELELAAKREDINELRRKHGPCMICYGELRQKLSMLLMG
ncbi:MAG: response regulator [Oscillibacter sp.]|nr:response regulator [Oscillibacter sp.]